MNKKVIVLAVAVIALIVIIAGAALAITQNAGADFEVKMELASKYLDEGDYVQAVNLFQEAIALEPENVAAHEGLYRTYFAAGHMEYARIALENGIQITGSDFLRGLLVELESSLAIDTTVEDIIEATQSPTEDVPTEDKQHNFALNEEILTFFASAKYADYNAKYGSPTVSISGGTYSYYYSAIAATAIYRDTNSDVVIDKNKGEPYNNYQPNEIQMDNVTMLFGGYDISYTTLKNLAGVSNPNIVGNTITFDYMNCIVTITCDGNEMITDSCVNSIVPDTQEAEVSQYVLVAKVLDATTNNYVPSAQVKAYLGYGTYGQAVTGSTDSTGKATLELTESGTYTIQVSKDGYITETFETYILGNIEKTEATYSISPTMSQDTMRFVLTWGSAPQDLDMYLIGTASDGSSVNINFTSMYKNDMNGNRIAELDVDDVSGFGPETVTLFDINGNYKLCISDFGETGTMAASGAQVKIYVGSSLYTTVDITSDAVNGWYVCDIAQGSISVRNSNYSVTNGVII